MNKQLLKFLPIFLLSLAGATRGYAQLQGQPLIDSILKELPKQKEDTNKVNVLNVLSFNYYRINPDEGIKYGEQAFELATILDWKIGQTLASLRIGSNYQFKSDYPKALEYFDKSLKMSEDIGYKKGIASVTNNMGNIYRYQSDYSKALEYYFKALKIDEEIGDKYLVAMVTANIGVIYRYKNDFARALEYDFKALKKDEEIGNKSEVAIVTGNIGVIYYNQHNYNEALAWHFKAEQLDKEIGDKHDEAAVLENIGDDYIDVATYRSDGGDAAQMTTAAESGSMPYRPDSLPAAQTSLIPKGKPALLRNAIIFLNKAISMDKEINSLDNLQSAYHSLSTADSLLGDISGAYYAHIQYTIYKDSVFSKENNEKITRMGMQNEYDKETAEAQKAAALKLQRQKVFTYSGVAGILLLVGFSFFIIKERGKSEKERKKSDHLLLNILPAEIATELKTKGATTARHFDNVTVLFTDFVNFTEAGERMKPQALIDELHTCFKAFDDITTKYNVEKIKTIGDAYLAVGGLPSADPLHAEHAVRAAIEINTFMQDRFAKLGNSTFEIRIGIHSGSVVAGIVGVKKFAYDIWGDTVNTAARMEQNSEAGKINISQTTYELVKDKLICEYRGEIDAKGKGQLKMYFIS